MKRSDALKALKSAIEDRLATEYDQLANGFMGDAAAKEKAKATFAHGVDLHIEALAFAASVIDAKFTD